MMREYLFRGKLAINDQWIYSRCPDGTLHSGVVGFDFIPETVGQFTGLTDKNGKKIFEGDIIKYHEPFVMKSTGVVCFGEHRWDMNTNVGFYVKWVIAPLPDILRTDFGFWCNEREIEVIGNIHDNPELLEGA